MPKLQCPFCHAPIKPGKMAVLVCLACDAPHHLGCVGESDTRRCVTCGGALKAPQSKSRSEDWLEDAAFERRVAYQGRSRQELSRPPQSTLMVKIGICLFLIGAPAGLGGLLGLSLSKKKPVRTIHVGQGYYETYDDGFRWDGFLPGLGAGALLGGILAAGALRSEQRPRRPLKRRPVGVPRREPPPEEMPPARRLRRKGRKKKA